MRRSNAPRAHDRKAEVVISFFETAAALLCDSPPIARSLAPTSALWVAWPRRAGGHESDVTEQLIRDVLLPIGIVDVKVAALDRDWSGLKFVWRREDRGKLRIGADTSIHLPEKQVALQELQLIGQDFLEPVTDVEVEVAYRVSQHLAPRGTCGPFGGITSRT